MFAPYRRRVAKARQEGAEEWPPLRMGFMLDYSMGGAAGGTTLRP